MRLGLRLDLWVYGLVSAFVGGGAASISTGLTAIGVAPESFNLSSGLHKTLVLMGATFLVNGIIAGAAYLKDHPAPAWDPQTQADRRGTASTTAPPPPPAAASGAS